MSKYILSKIKSKKINIGIIGLGYVGLPLAIRFLNKNYNVQGIEIDNNKINLIKKGICYIENKKFGKNLQFKKFFKDISSDYSAIKNVDIIIICLPTPLSNEGKPDISILKNCAIKLRPFLKSNQIFVLESTVYPGATFEIFKILNKNRDLRIGKNFNLIYSPERENPGDKNFSYKSTTKVVSGYSKSCKEIGLVLYKVIAKKVFVAKSIIVAEMSKLLENTYRSVNIGLVNEFKIISDKLGLNIWDVIEAAKTKNFGYRSFNPGPGVGGHCIPIDPIYLSWFMRKKKYKTKIIEISSKLNSSMPNWVFNKIYKHIKQNKIKLKKLIFIGIAYKKNTSDTRGSPSIDIIKRFLKKNYFVEFYDPHVKNYRLKHKFFREKTLNFSSIKNKSKSAIIIIGTDHKNINYKSILKVSKTVFDTRGVLRNFKNEKIIYV